MLSNAVLYLNEPSISCLGYWAMALWHLGDPDQARKKIQEAVQLSRELAHAHTLTISLLFDAMLSQFCRNAEETRLKATELIQICFQEGFSLWQIAGEVLHGWALTKLGQERAGVEQLQSGLGNWEYSGAKLFRIYWLALLVEACVQEGDVEKGLRALDDGLHLSCLSGETWWQSELYRLKGELLLTQGNQEEATAEANFLQARRIAQQQGARSLELRAVISCSRLWHKTDRKEEARVLLQAIYEKFSSGRDTGDLKEAADLLNELSE